MDGNRRWAHAQGLTTAEGHATGFEAFKRCLAWARARGVRHLAFYAFSTENWQRQEAEVSALMELIGQALTLLPPDGTRLQVIGDRRQLPRTLVASIEAKEAETANETELVVWIALSYGGRDEIVRATNAAIARGELVDPDSFSMLLDTADLPDPDMIVRTGGEQRLSNFLTWRSVYSELYFTDTYWPAMTETDFDAILAEYGNRQRRYGT